MPESSARFGCPQCGLKLRIRAEATVERRIACPGCHVSLRVRFDRQAGTVEVIRETVAAPPGAAASPPANSSVVAATSSAPAEGLSPSPKIGRAHV